MKEEEELPTFWFREVDILPESPLVLALALVLVVFAVIAPVDGFIYPSKIHKNNIAPLIPKSTAQEIPNKQ